MHVLGTLILPSASKMCISFFPLTRKKKKKSTRKLVTLLDGSKPSFSPLSLSKYLLYDTYIYISIYILQKRKGKKSQLWRYILQCITCLRTTAALVVPHTEILVRKLKLQWLRDTHEKQTTFCTIKGLHKHKEYGLSRHATGYCNACANNLRICSVPTGCSFER